MSFEEKTAPLSISHEGVRFVFFLAPQLVMDNLDHLPYFVLSLWDKKNTENVRRLYVSCRADGIAHDLQVFQYDTSEADRARAEESEELILEHLKKHFGRKTYIELEQVKESLDSEDMSIADVLVSVYWDAVRLNNEFGGPRITLARNMVKHTPIIDVDFGGIGRWVFHASAEPIETQLGNFDLSDGFYGTITISGIELNFTLAPKRVYCGLSAIDLLQFMTPRLVEDVLAKAFGDLYPEMAKVTSFRISSLSSSDLRKTVEAV